MLNLDTHILVYAFTGDLTARERKLLSLHQWSVSVIVFWELAKLIQLGRIAVTINSGEFRKFIAPIHVWPVTLEICYRIEDLDFKSDPADELISATSMVYDLPLVTRDQRILGSSIVPLA